MNMSSEGNTVSVYEAMENFKIFNVKESPSTCAVVNGGWIIYSLPSYKGASLIHFEGGQKMISTSWLTLMKNALWTALTKMALKI
jgi:hypothetical protein